MARMNDMSPHPGRWTNAKLMREAKRLASYESAGLNLPEGYVVKPWHAGGNDTPAIIEATRIYRESWLNPILDEIERRLVK